MIIAFLVGGPLHGYQVRADILDPHKLGSLTLRYGVNGSHATYWRRDEQPMESPELWEWKP